MASVFAQRGESIFVHTVLLMVFLQRGYPVGKVSSSKGALVWGQDLVLR